MMGDSQGTAPLPAQRATIPITRISTGRPLSAGYSRGNPYFRNTPTLLNASKMPYYDWDGRFAQGDLATVVRDHIAEAHFMSLDGRLLVERMRQVPEYEESFKDVFGSEVSYGKVLNAVAAYLETLESSADNPYVALQGRRHRCPELSGRGEDMELFEGKAGCVSSVTAAIFSPMGSFTTLVSRTTLRFSRNPSVTSRSGVSSECSA